MKLQFPLSAPRRDDATILPALLVAVLAIMLVSQMLVPADVEMPQPVLAGARMPSGVAGLQVMPVRASETVVTHNLFAPGRSQSGALGKVPGAALDGAIIAGTIGSGARMRAIVVKPGGAMTFVGRGGLVNGWQVVALTGDHAQLRRGADKLDMPYGGAMPQNAESGERTNP